MELRERVAGGARGDPAALAEGAGEVPAVDDGLGDQFAGVAAGVPYPVAEVDQEVGGAGPGECALCAARGHGPDAQRVAAEDVALEAVADLGRGVAGDRLAHPEVLGGEVVHQCAHVPVAARGGCGPEVLGRRAQQPGHFGAGGRVVLADLGVESGWVGTLHRRASVSALLTPSKPLRGVTRQRGGGRFCWGSPEEGTARAHCAWWW